MSAEQSTSVPGGLLHSCLRHCQSAASAIGRPPPAVCSTTLTFDLQPPGLLCHWFDDLELVTRQCIRLGTRFSDSFQWDLKTFLSSSYYHAQCIRGLAIIALYKSIIDIDIGTSSFVSPCYLHYIYGSQIVFVLPSFFISRYLLH